MPNTTFNPLDKSSLITLDTSDLIATIGSAPPQKAAIRGTQSRSSGKRYLEFQNVGDSGGTTNFFGFADATVSLSNPNLTFDNCIVLFGGGVDAGVYANFFNSLVVDTVLKGGITVCCALDLDAGHVWFRADNGPWNAGGSADPGTLTGGLAGANHFAGASLYPFWGSQQNGSTATLATTFAQFKQTVPTGFSPWDLGGGPPVPTSWATIIH